MNLMIVFYLFFFSFTQTAEFLDSHPHHRQVEPPNVAPANPFDPQNDPAEGAETPEEIKEIQLNERSPQGIQSVLDPGKKKQAKKDPHADKNAKEVAVGDEDDDAKLMKMFDDLDDEDGGPVASTSSDKAVDSKYAGPSTEESNHLPRLVTAEGIPFEKNDPVAKVPEVKDWLHDLDSKIKAKLSKDSPLDSSAKLSGLKDWKPAKLDPTFDIGKEFSKRFSALDSVKKKTAAKVSSPTRAEAVPVTPADKETAKKEAEGNGKDDSPEESEKKQSTKLEKEKTKEQNQGQKEQKEEKKEEKTLKKEESSKEEESKAPKEDSKSEKKDLAEAKSEESEKKKEEPKTPKVLEESSKEKESKALKEDSKVEKKDDLEESKPEKSEKKKDKKQEESKSSKEDSKVEKKDVPEEVKSNDSKTPTEGKKDESGSPKEAKSEDDETPKEAKNEESETTAAPQERKSPETTGEAQKDTTMPAGEGETTSAAKSGGKNLTTEEAKETSEAPKKEEGETTSAPENATTREANEIETTAEKAETTAAPGEAKETTEKTVETTAPGEAKETTEKISETTAPGEAKETTEKISETTSPGEAKETTEKISETTKEAKDQEKTPETTGEQKSTETTGEAKKPETTSEGEGKSPETTEEIKAETTSNAKETTAETTGPHRGNITHLTTTPTTTTERFLSPEPEKNGELKKVATAMELKCEGLYSEVIGSKKKEFLAQCSEYFAPAACTDVWAGSVVIAVKAESNKLLQDAIEMSYNKGVKLKGFPPLAVDSVTYTDPKKMETTNFLFTSKPPTKDADTTATPTQKAETQGTSKPTGEVPIVPTNKYTIEVIGHPTTTKNAKTTTTTQDIESHNESTMPPMDVKSSDKEPAKLVKFLPLPDDSDSQAELQMQWQGFSCETGKDNMCKTCVQEHLITAKNQCDECNLGFALVDGKCMPIPCETGIEFRCKKCASQNERKYHNFCSECNEGYYLVDGSCVVAEVTLTEKNMKKWDSEIFNGRPEAVNYTVSDLVQQIGQLEPAEKGTDNMFNPAWAPVSKNVNTKLINGPQIRKIEKWIGIEDQTWELCYRKSGHGGNALTFHKLCGGKGPTITIIKLHTGKVIGMYTSLSWGSLSKAYNLTGKYRLDESSFLFSITNDFKHKRAHSKQYSIFDYHFFGPTFGGGHDIRVDYNMSSVSCRLGFSYECRTGEALNKKCTEDFCGAPEVRIADIEVHFLNGPRTLSSVLISQASKERLEHWAEGDRMEWRLCYRRSKDGGDKETLLKKCAGKGATYTVAQLSTGRLVGGFTRQAWGGECYQKDSSAFLFRLPTPEMPSAYKHETIRDEWQICGGNRAPRFGGGPDFIINSKLNAGYCNLGHTYACAKDLSYGQQACHEDFCGVYRGWKILELEMWVVHGPLSAESKHLTPNMVAKLNEWIGIPQMHLRTCFRKSDYNPKDITRCKGINGPTVTVFLLPESRIIGAFSSISPKKGAGFRFDSSAFLFSLHSDTHFNVTGIDWKYTQVGASHYDSSKAVLDSPKRSFAYGGGDFSLNSDLTHGVCNLGYTYKCRVGSYPSDACLRDFCGEFNVTVLDVEQMKIQCSPGFVLSGSSCQPYTCQIGKDNGCQSCAALSDRRHNDHCASCNPGYALAYGTCVKYSCKTSKKGPGCLTCADDEKRQQNDHCETCNEGYLIQGNSCKEHACDSWPDSPSCKTCIPLKERWKSNQCASCWPGYHLNSMKCVPFTCDTSEQMDSCASCVAQSARTKDNHCDTCNPGFGVKDGDCIPFDCTTGEGDMCAECAPQANRTIENHCSKCNPGRFLTEGTCKMYDCVTGPRDACKECVEVTKRTADGQCTACNEGFLMGNDKSCIPLPCETGKAGASCLQCADPERRKVENQCSACHPGYFLTNSTCKSYTCSPEKAHCSKCLAQDKRTGHNQCEPDSCEKGYLFDKGICKPIPCATTNLVGKGCKTCAAESERKHMNHCAGCHDGFDLWEGWCVVYCDPKDNKWDCCSREKPCGPKSGDCDKDADCAGDLKCAEDVGKQFGAYQSMDICMEGTLSEGREARLGNDLSANDALEQKIESDFNANDWDHQITRWKYALGIITASGVLIFFLTSFCTSKPNLHEESQRLLEAE